MLKAALFNINDVFPAAEQFAEPSLGLGYIKSYYEGYSLAGEPVSISVLKKGISAELKRLQPEIIGISSVTQDYTNAIAYAKQLKAGGCRAMIFIGGIHISNLPESLDPVFDAAIIGEGEEAVREFFDSLAQYGPVKKKWSEIKGLAFYQDDNLFIAPRRALIDDLDRIPFPCRTPHEIKTFTSMLTSRGCPFRCSFCSSAVFWGQDVRFHSAPRVVEEMKKLIKNFRLKHISIWDDLFCINNTRLQQIVNLIKKDADIFRNTSFGVTARANIVNEELCLLLKEMNVARVSLGIESGSDRILKLLNRGLAKEDNYRAINLLRKYGFLVNGGFIVGSPGETLEDLNQTYDFILNSRLDTGGIGLATPFPNTAFWDYARKAGKVSNQMDFSNLVFIHDPASIKAESDFLLLSEDVERKEFLKIIAKMHAFFALRNVSSLFNRRNLNFRNAAVILSNPLTFLPLIFSAFKKLFKAAINKNAW